jgi:hypothetical protein
MILVNVYKHDNNEPYVTGFTFGKVDFECNIHGWLFLNIKNPPWT